MTATLKLYEPDKETFQIERDLHLITDILGHGLQTMQGTANSPPVFFQQLARVNGGLTSLLISNLYLGHGKSSDVVGIINRKDGKQEINIGLPYESGILHPVRSFVQFLTTEGIDPNDRWFNAIYSNGSLDQATAWILENDKPTLYLARGDNRNNFSVDQIQHKQKDIPRRYR